MQTVSTVLLVILPPFTLRTTPCGTNLPDRYIFSPFATYIRTWHFGSWPRFAFCKAILYSPPIKEDSLITDADSLLAIMGATICDPERPALSVTVRVRRSKLTRVESVLMHKGPYTVTHNTYSSVASGKVVLHSM